MRLYIKADKCIGTRELMKTILTINHWCTVISIQANLFFVKKIHTHGIVWRLFFLVKLSQTMTGVHLANNANFGAAQNNSFCVRVCSDSAAKKKKKKKKKTEKKYNILLSETVFFPTGGGQPADKGTISGHAVLDVFRASDGLVYHQVNTPLEVGSVVTAKLDWERRFDFMQQHSSQHLISAVTIQLFGFRTLSWGLSETNPDTSIELGLDASCADASMTGKLSSIETKVNEYIRNGNRVVATEYPIKEALALDGLRLSSNALPDGLTHLRVVDMEGVEITPCCGTHVSQLGQLQMIKFTGVEKTKKGCLVYFRAGNRVLANISTALSREAALSKELCCGGEQHVNRVVKLKQDAKEYARKVKALEDEVALMLVQTLKLQEAQTDDAGAKVCLMHRTDDTLKFLGRLASEFYKLSTPDGSNTCLLLSCGDEHGAGNFLLAGPVEKVKMLGPKVAAVLGGRGGGRNGRFQGRVKNLSALPEAKALLQ